MLIIDFFYVIPIYLNLLVLYNSLILLFNWYFLAYRINILFTKWYLLTCLSLNLHNNPYFLFIFRRDYYYLLWMNFLLICTFYISQISSSSILYYVRIFYALRIYIFFTFDDPFIWWSMGWKLRRHGWSVSYFHLFNLRYPQGFFRL